MKSGRRFRHSAGDQQALPPLRLLPVAGAGFQAGAFGPGVPHFAHLPGAIGVRLGQVVGFGPVGLEIVQLPAAEHLVPDDFPFALADGAVAGEFPTERTVAGPGFALKNRHQTEAFDRDDRIAFESSRVLRPGSSVRILCKVTLTK